MNQFSCDFLLNRKQVYRRRYEKPKLYLKNNKYVLYNAARICPYLKNWFLVQNFTGIGQSAAELWPKNDFQYGGRTSSWILKIFVTVIEFQIYQIASKSNDFSSRYGDLTIFKMADVRHLEF